MQITDNLIITCENNRSMYSRYPDKYFDLASEDPPYFSGPEKRRYYGNKVNKLNIKRIDYPVTDTWYIPDEEWFNEVKRVSKNQIIWGANYFGLVGGMIYWHKNVTMPTYSTGELAWVSWQNKLNFVDISWHGMIQHDMKNKENIIHPTQKPVKLYKWLLDNYGKKGDKILDTHLGSGSIAIACHDYDFELTACELDPDYYNSAVKRIKQHIGQQKLF